MCFECKKYKYRIRRCEWRNGILLRSIYEFFSYKPINFIENINVPVLYLALENDDKCPKDKIEFMSKITKRSQFTTIDMGHHEASEENFTEMAKAHLKFLRNLPE